MNARLVNDGRVSARLGLYRNTRCGRIAGVCCGIADRLGVKPLWVRLAFIALAAVTHGVMIIIYIVLTVVLQRGSFDPGYAALYPSSPPGNNSPGYFADRLYPNRPTATMNNAPEPPPAGPPPGNRLAEAAARFAALDARLNQIEAAVMSDELSLRRKFRDLGG
jgi:phage shock protein C